MLWKEFLSFSESCEPSHLDAIFFFNYSRRIVLALSTFSDHVPVGLSRCICIFQFGGVGCRSILHLFINIAYYVKLLDLIDILGAKFRKSFSSFFFVCYFFKIFQVGLSQKLLTVSYVDRKSSTDFI